MNQPSKASIEAAEKIWAIMEGSVRRNDHVSEDDFRQIVQEATDKDNRELIERVKELEEALKKYGHHNYFCDMSEENCNCGFTDALNPPKKEAE